MAFLEVNQKAYLTRNGLKRLLDGCSGVICGVLAARLVSGSSAISGIFGDAKFILQKFQVFKVSNVNRSSGVVRVL
jgi:hypothetical protein